MKQIFKKRYIAILLGIFVFIFACSMISILLEFEFFNKLLDGLDGAAYDLAFKCFKAKLNPSDEIIIVDVETSTPIINRDNCFELIERLSNVGAKVIGFDILFKKTDFVEAENKLIQLSEKLDNVIHSFCVEGDVPLDVSQLVKRRRLAEFNAIKENVLHFENDFEPLRFDDGRMRLPFDTVLSVLNGSGHVNFITDNDHVARRFPLIITYDRKYYSSLSLQILRKYFDIDDDNFHVYLSDKNQSIIIKPSIDKFFYIPIDKYAQILVNFIPEEKFRNMRMSLQEALLISQDPNNADFRNKVVLIINSVGIEGQDKSVTPLSDQYPNWLIHASIISQILQHEFIEESAWHMFIFAFWAILIMIIWLVLIEFRLKWIKAKSWLVLLILFFLLFGAAVIRLNMGVWPSLIVSTIVLIVSYISIKVTLFTIPSPHPTPYQYKDFEIHIQKRIKSKYLVDVIKSPAGEAYEGEFKLNLKEFENIVDCLQTFNAPRPKVRNFGKELFEAVFQNQVKNRYSESLGIIKRSDDDRLNIKLRIEPPELMILPWEYFYDPERNEHLVLSKELSIVRYPLMPKMVEPLEVVPPLKILLIISTPSDCQMLDVEKEKMKIDKELRKMKWKRQIKLDVLNHTTVEKVRDKIKKYHVIHYIGHGGFVKRQDEEIGCLIFEDQAGKSDLVDAERLSLLLRQPRIRLVILNACETAKTSTYNAFLGVAPALVNAGVPAVIAMQFPMPDLSGVIFSEEFYRSLARHYQVDAALTDARIGMAERIGVDRIDWGIPVLFMRSPDGVLFRPKI